MPELIIGSFRAPSGKGTVANVSCSSTWQKSDRVDINIAADITDGKIVNCSVAVEHGLIRNIDVRTSVVNYGDFLSLDSLTTTRNLGVYAFDGITKTTVSNDLLHADNSEKLNYRNILPTHDAGTAFYFNAVHVFDEKPNPPSDYKYYPTSDFSFNDELTGFTSDFVNPIDFDKLITPLSPIGFTSSLPWSTTKKVDIPKRLSYGYGLNDFLVGGSTESNYPVDEDAITPPPTEPTPTPEVITIVNTVTVVALPNREPLLFSNVRLSKDIDSFSWDCSLTLLDKPSYNLVKPSATETKDIEVSINGTIWQFFIGKTRKSKQFGSTTYIATGYSHSAKLQSPYAATNNYSNNSSALASQLVDDILSGTGFTSNWAMPVNWPVAVNGFNYQNKSPIDAIAQIASSAGAVISPDLVNKTITIKPWSYDSAWLWGDLFALPVLDEALCYELNEQFNPKEQANAIYVSGGAQGVLLKGKLPGTAGDVLLQTVTDELITDTSVASERARIQLSKSGNKEDVPITTFVDSETSLLMTGEMVTINMMDEANWNGMVTSLSIAVEGAGVSVFQTLNVLRHYQQG